jgi:NitT/TauT family transport system substrate-binding protein
MPVKKIRLGWFFILVFVFTALFCLSCRKHSNQHENQSDLSQSTYTDSLHRKSIVFKSQWLHQAQFAGFYVAYKKGFYSNYGIDVKIEMGGPDKPSPEALNNKQADLVSMFLTTALREVNKRNQIVNIAQISQKSSLLLVAKKSSGISNIKDLNGKKIGLWVNDFQEPSLTLLNKYNIKAEIIPVSWTTNVLTHDVVDVLNMMLYNEYDIFVNSGYEPSELTIFPLADYGVNIPEDGIYARKEFYLENQDVCHDFAEATMDGWIYALNHEEETLSIVLSYLREAHLPANIPHQRWMLKKVREAVLYNPNQFGRLSEKDYNSAVQMLKSNRVIEFSLPYQEFVGYAAAKKN